MKKPLLVFTCLAMTSLFADLIYWQVTGMGESTASSFDYAQFVQVRNGTDTALRIADADGNPTSYTMAFSDGTKPDGTGTTTGGGVWAYADSLSDSDTFRLELYDAGGNNVGWTWEASYAEIEQLIKRSATDRVVVPWTPTVVPEPTGGLLVLLGGALLALRRRRRA